MNFFQKNVANVTDNAGREAKAAINFKATWINAKYIEKLPSFLKSTFEARRHNARQLDSLSLRTFEIADNGKVERLDREKSSEVELLSWFLHFKVNVHSPPELARRRQFRINFDCIYSLVLIINSKKQIHVSLN